MTPEAAKNIYWGPSPLPKGATSLGLYRDDRITGCLIKLANGIKVVGNAGIIRGVKQ